MDAGRGCTSWVGPGSSPARYCGGVRGGGELQEGERREQGLGRAEGGGRVGRKGRRGGQGRREERDRERERGEGRRKVPPRYPFPPQARWSRGRAGHGASAGASQTTPARSPIYMRPAVPAGLESVIR